MGSEIRIKGSLPPKKAVIDDSDTILRILTEMTASAMFIVWGNRFRYVNPATEALTGYAQKELLELDYIALFSPGERKEARRAARQLLSGEVPSVHSEAAILTKTGEERWIDLTVASVSPGGKAAFIGTAYDITDRKRAELLQEAVFEIAQAADRSRHLDDLFPALRAIIAEVMLVKNIYFALYDQSRNLITYPYYIDEYDEPAQSSAPGKGLTEYVLRTGKSLLCDLDTHTRLEKSGEIELIGTPSPIWLGVPLKIDNDVIGVLVVQDYSHSETYGIREQRILEFVSSQVAMAINRKRSEDVLLENEARIRRRAEELEALYETTRDLAAQRDTRALLQTIVDRAASLLTAAGGSIYLYNQERNELELKVAYGAQEFVGERISPGEGLVGQVMQTLEPMVVEDYRVWKGRSDKFDLLDPTAVLAVPMLYSGELVGAISVYEVAGSDLASSRKFNRSEVDLLIFFASAAAGAVHNAKLIDETRQRLVELELLYQASLSASQIHSQRAVAQIIVDTIGQLLEWNTTIWVNDDQKPVLLAYSARYHSSMEAAVYSERMSRSIGSFGQGVIGWVCQNGQSVRSGDVRNNPHYIVINDKITSNLCVPLRVGGRTIGCIDATSEQTDDFSEQDERLFTTLANQASVAIENARLFEETRKRAIQQQALNSIITASTRSGSDLDALLNDALDQIMKALTVNMGAIWLSPTGRSVHRTVAKGVPASIGFIMTNAAVMGEVTLKNTIVVDDWNAEPHPFSDIFDKMGIKAGIVVPLLFEGKHIGGLAIVAAEPRTWAVEETAFVESIGREVGAAAERARLFEETQLRLKELEAINRVSRALRSASSLEKMLPLLIEETLGALGTESGSIWLVDAERKNLLQVIGRGWCLRIADLNIGSNEGIPGMVFSSEDIYFARDIATDLRTSPPMRERIPSGWSGLCVPIRTEEETIGVFLVSSQLPREFYSDDARLLVTLAEMAGASIQRMRLVEKTANYATQLELRVAERTAELKEALEKAQAADRLKTEFIANINHELRTPLTNLILYYQMLRTQPTVKTEERLDVIGREMQRLRTLIEDLLNLSRLDLGQVVVNPVERDLNSIILTLVEDRRSLAEERGLEIRTELLPGLPLVPLDEATIVQAISNLLTNAMNYTPRGGSVTIRTNRQDQDGTSWACFIVQDTGLGIDQEEIPHLFERFYRGRAAHQSGSPGTGLGLPIVKQVVERHRGRIEIGNDPQGHGAIFTIWIPLANARETG